MPAVTYGSARVAAVLRDLLEGRRPDEAGALLLAGEAEVPLLALAAGEMARRRGAQVGYAPDVTIAYTGTCDAGCPMCGEGPAPGAAGAYRLRPEEAAARAAEAAARGAVQAVLQGGHPRDLSWNDLMAIVRAVRAAAPGMRLVALSATDLILWAEREGRPAAELAAGLRAAGADVLPAAALDAVQGMRGQEARRLLSGPWPEWEEAALAAARTGLRLVATLPVGAGESPRDQALYLLRLRALQDRLLAAGSAGFTAVAVLPASARTPAYGYLRAVALARLLADNVPHVQTSVLVLGAKVAQVALGGGADDLGGTHLEVERLELAAGREGPFTPEEAERLIRDAGGEPVVRRLGEL
ncbi:hypothetical protein [Caldinitratiruptor microaerophilus]|uniref:CofH/MqnC-like C-terminal domain-containing protein n=1 Tax=Caldinitratiruptor microaerophilus TaxID=671077 RepID=A0AA35CM72_9FIRM|nr:hypothetical protein [Caldinitratiruptor microaerophilus]BDG60943.1 hypothetical protein caldi_20330 [Caldinitratiruptor microaerophilus]